MRDVTSLQIGSNGTELTILFEDEAEAEEREKENKNKPREWDLVTAHPQERDRIIKMLSLLWKNLFRINLPIDQKS